MLQLAAATGDAVVGEGDKPSAAAREGHGGGGAGSAGGAGLGRARRGQVVLLPERIEADEEAGGAADAVVQQHEERRARGFALHQWVRAGGDGRPQGGDNLGEVVGD